MPIGTVMIRKLGRVVRLAATTLLTAGAVLSLCVLLCPAPGSSGRPGGRIRTLSVTWFPSERPRIVSDGRVIGEPSERARALEQARSEILRLRSGLDRIPIAGTGPAADSRTGEPG